MRPIDLAVLEAVRASPIAQALTEEQIRVLAGLVNLRSWQRGDVLAQEGTVDDRLIVIVDGAVAVIKHRGTPDESLLVTLRAGDLAHELGFLDGTPRNASLVAAEAARVLVLSRKALESVSTRSRASSTRSCARSCARRTGCRHALGQAVELMNYVFQAARPLLTPIR
jgi:CRP-like cAMP-binding protein